MLLGAPSLRQSLSRRSDQNPVHVHRIKPRCHAKYHVLPNKFSSFSSDEEVDVLLGLQHLRGPLHADHRSQPLGIVLGVEDSAGPGGFLSSGGGSQHVADFAVEVGICWQLIENQVPDAFYSVPVRRGKRGQVYLRNVQESYLRDLQGRSSLRPLRLEWEDKGTNNRPKATLTRARRDYFCDNIFEFLIFGLRDDKINHIS